ncbi:Scn8a [Symbiodinium sp. KB8]|nr:Scn8a [Symbiodinium sp. KB8]
MVQIDVAVIALRLIITVFCVGGKTFIAHAGTITSQPPCGAMAAKDESSDICGDAVPVLFQPDTELLLKTMQTHHEQLMDRLDQQEKLLRQEAQDITSATSPQIFVTSDSGSLLASVQPEQHYIGNAAPGILSARNARSEVPSLGLSNSYQLRSYSAEDTQLRDDADNAESIAIRKRFSDMQAPEKKGPGSHTRLLHSDSIPWTTRIVHNPAFDIFFAVIVFANAIFIGFDIQWTLDGREYAVDVVRTKPVIYMIFHYTFSALFLGELLLRLADSRCRYYCSEEWKWAFLDTLIVATSFWDIAVDVISAMLQDDSWDSISGLSTLKAMRIVRLTRVLKTAHFIRIFRFIMALRMLVQSILHTVKALFWALLLLTLIVYVFAILFSQAVYDYMSDEANPELPPDVQAAADRYFRSLVRSMMALFMSIAGGVSWEEVIRPLMFVSAFWEVCFLFFIAFSYLAVLNVVTAVFCHAAIESAQKDHTTVVQNMLDNKEQHLQKLRALFEKIGDKGAGGITYRVFEEKINSPAVRDYFETLGLDVWDPWSFFKLLDTDGGGVVELEEFFMGCLRFSGDATAMELGKLAADQRWLIRSHGRFQRLVEAELVQTRENLSSLVDAVFNSSGNVCSTHL